MVPSKGNEYARIAPRGAMRGIYEETMALQQERGIPTQVSADLILRVADKIGREVLAPHAEEADSSLQLPRANVAALAATGLFGLSIPRAFGGLEAEGPVILQVHETLARYCAVTSFVLNQHVGVCRSIAAANPPLAPEILPQLARGELIAGIAASHLRRSGEPMLRCTRVEGGYRLDGDAPWASGYGLMTHLAIGALLDDAPLFLWVPFTPAPGISFGEPMDLAVMRATATVSVHCDDLFVPEDRMIGDDRHGYWRTEHGGALSSPVSYLLGIGAACLDGMRARLERGGTAEQRERCEYLAERLEEVRAQFYDLQRKIAQQRDDPNVLDDLLATRVEVTDLVLELATVAIALEGGTAHLRSNPAQRHLREASFFLTATINAEMRDALVTRL